MSLFKSIATFGGFTFVSRITGFLRDMVLANLLGAGMVSDAFFVSFKLPNLFRSLFAEGAFTSAFVPIFSQKLVAEGKKKSLLFAAQTVTILILFLALFVACFEALMPYVVRVLAPGFIHDAGKMELAAALCRITFPYGITLAGIFEIIWLQYFLVKQGVRPKLYPHPKKIMQNKEIRTLFKRIAPGVVGAGIYQINMVVDTILVSLVGTGAISWLYYANRLQQLPLGVVGAAISVALLPILS